MDYEKLSNNDLIKRCAEDSANPLALNEFVRRFDEYIRLMVKRYCGVKHLHLADDLAQDVYELLWKDEQRVLRKYIGKTDNSIYTYLLFSVRTTVNKLEKKGKAQKRLGKEISLYHSVSLEDDAVLLLDVVADPYAPSPDEKTMLESSRHEVEMILDEVISGNDKERDKRIFLLYIYDDLTAQEISENVGLSPQRVRNIITLIKKHLKTKLRGGSKS